MSRDMDFSKNTSVKSVKNDSSDNTYKNYNNDIGRDTFVNVDQRSDSQDNDGEEGVEKEDEDEHYEILLLPDRSQYGFVQSQNRLSPPLVPQSKQTTVLDSNDSTDLLSGGLYSTEQHIEGNVSPTRIALSNIQEFAETTVVLRKDKKNELGISIVGGNDTLFGECSPLI